MSPDKTSKPSHPGGTRMTPFIMFPKDGVKALKQYKAAFGKDYAEVSVASDGKQLHQGHEQPFQCLTK